MWHREDALQHPAADPQKRAEQGKCRVKGSYSAAALAPGTGGRPFMAATASASSGTFFAP